ncbi:hypothetical protein D3C78_1773940 [compost metagenome]
MKPIGGLQYNMDAFTTLKPLPPSSVDTEKVYRNNPNIWEAQSIGNEMFQAVIEEKKSVREALAEWETRGNAILEQQTPDEGTQDGAAVEIKPAL